MMAMPTKVREERKREENTREGPEMNANPPEMIGHTDKHTEDSKSSLGVGGRFACDALAEAMEDDMPQRFGE